MPTVDYNAGIILHSATDTNAAGRRQQANAKKINWFFMTNDSGANPYDSLPAFFLSNF